MITDASQKDAVEFIVDYSAFRSVFNEWLAPPGRRPPPAQLLLFRSQSTFDRWCGESSERNVRKVAVTFNVDSAALLALSLDGNRREALRMTYLFDTIWSLNRVGIFLPLWAAQGTGEVMSTLRVKKGQCLLGQEPNDYAVILRQKNWLAWPEFSKITASDPFYQKSERGGLFFAQAWAAMHYVLLDRPADAREKLAKLSTHPLEKPRTDAAPAAGLAAGPGATEKEINHHLGTFHTVQIPFDEPAIRAKLRVSPAAGFEVAVWLSELLRRTGNKVEADAELGLAGSLAPDAPLVKEARARRELAERNGDQAIGLYREAIASGSINPRAYLESATARLDAGQSDQRDCEGQGGVPAEIALTEVRRALALDPGSGEAYVLLGRALYVAPRISGTDVDELTPGLAAPELGPFVRYYRALLLRRLGRTEECLDDLRSIKDSPHVAEDLRSLARTTSEDVLYDAVFREVKPLVARHDFAGALRALAAAPRSPAGQGSNGRYEALRNQIEEQAALEHLNDLGTRGQLEEFRRAGREFLQQFPHSAEAAKVRQAVESGPPAPQ